MRIAVIGSGVAGLSACRALAGRAQVDLYESRSRAGGHVCTAVDPATGTAIDMGFIVWNRERYPRFGALLTELGIDSVPSDMAFSVAREDGSLELGSRDLSAWFAQRGNLVRPRHYRRLARVMRFLANARRDLRAGRARDLSLDEYLTGRGVPDETRAELVEPLAAALWSMAPERIADFPAETLLRFLDQHGMLRAVRPLAWWTVRGGARRYVDALLAKLSTAPHFALHLSTPVRSLRRRGNRVELTVDGATRGYDRVIMALHADRALALLADADRREHQVLGSIGFTDNEVWLHTDERLLPRSAAARASWNYVVPADRQRVAVTYWMNRLQALPGPVQYLVTLNPRRPIDEGRVLRHERFRHPLFDLRALRGQAALPHIQGRRRVYWCGAWTGYGFHEDGMRSGLAASARALADEAGGGGGGGAREAAA